MFRWHFKTSIQTIMTHPAWGLSSKKSIIIIYWVLNKTEMYFSKLSSFIVLDDLSIFEKSCNLLFFLQLLVDSLRGCGAHTLILSGAGRNTLWHWTPQSCLCKRKNIYISAAWIVVKLLLCLQWLMVSLQSALSSTKGDTTHTHTILQNHWFCFE